MTSDLSERIGALVTALEPLDEVEAAHRDEALGWIASTSDLFRRQSRPVEPREHLVSYFLLVDSAERLVLLGDHIKSGLWLQFHPALGPKPLFLTATERPMAATRTAT